MELLSVPPGSYSVYDLKHLTNLTAPDQASEFKAWLKAMQADGRLIPYVSGRRGPVQPILQGVVNAHPKGFGFITVKPEHRKHLPEVFVAPATMGVLLSGDHVHFHCVPGRDGRGDLGEVLTVDRPETAWLGTLIKAGVAYILKPDMPATPQLVVTGVPEGLGADEVVLVHVPAGAPLGQVVEAHFVRTLGVRTRAGFDTDYAIASHMLPASFSAAALAEAEALEEPSLEPGRRDLRDTNFVTIDGDYTRDFDDAINVTRHPDHFVLKVAIADVSHYVRPGSALDQEAWNRGTSVYFPDRVVPMLPEVLSNGLCSLNPDEPRLALVCEMRIELDGDISTYAFYNAMVESKARLSYGQVAAFAEGLVPAVPAEQVFHLADLMALCEALEVGRANAAGLQLHSKEAKLYLGPDGSTHIKWSGPTVAHRYVELCMLAANHCAARTLKDSGLAGLFRHHKGPSQADWDDARAILRERGITLSEMPSLREMATILEQTKAQPDAPQIENVLLKMLPAASYDALKPEHFSLDVLFYAHFTSPIRRYPDLVVHRALKAHLLAKDAVQDALADGLAEHCSERAARAQRASNQVWTKLKRRYVAQHQVGAVSGAKVVKASARGIKVFLQEWQTMAWLPAGGEPLPSVEEGQLLQVQVQGATDTDITLALCPSSLPAAAQGVAHDYCL